MTYPQNVTGRGPLNPSARAYMDRVEMCILGLIFGFLFFMLVLTASFLKGCNDEAYFERHTIDYRGDGICCVYNNCFDCGLARND